MIALPVHDPCGAAGCGTLDAANVATCTTRRTWIVKVNDEPGCGKRFALNHHGLRVEESEVSPCR